MAKASAIVMATFPGGCPTQISADEQGYRITLIRKVARPGARLPYGARPSVLKVLSAMARAPTTPHSGMDLSFLGRTQIQKPRVIATVHTRA